ncbi:hypothetical protein ElyMa_006043500 [Elysia marginata]|uniref:Uncharacterized protein n=1 Tax=Elysia marginata TaxID=1093978 RepID=A0AAV4GM05_9GAST|nr:hypothetical protein ElyMa_006043500 [Elysia marginata]
MPVPRNRKEKGDMPSQLNHSNIIHLITCTKCSNQYISKTKQNSPRARSISITLLATLRFAINNDRHTSVTKHFDLDDPSYDHVNITTTDQLPGLGNILPLTIEVQFLPHAFTADTAL